MEAATLTIVTAAFYGLAFGPVVALSAIALLLQIKPARPSERAAGNQFFVVSRKVA